VNITSIFNRIKLTPKTVNTPTRLSIDALEGPLIIKETLGVSIKLTPDESEIRPRNVYLMG